MKVTKLIEHKDGSATCTLEMDNDEMAACIEEGFISMLRKSIEYFEKTCPIIVAEEAKEKPAKKRIKKNV